MSVLESSFYLLLTKKNLDNLKLYLQSTFQTNDLKDAISKLIWKVSIFYLFKPKKLIFLFSKQNNKQK